MKKNILPIFLCLLTLPSFAQYMVKGGEGAPLLAKNDTDNRIQVYFLNGLSGAEISFTSSTSTPQQWYKYTDKVSNADTIPSQQSGNFSSITDVSDGTGYFVGDPTSMQTSYIWIVDYSKYMPVFNSITIEESDDRCERIKLLTNFDVERIDYITASGRKHEILREFQLRYSTMQWDHVQLAYTEKPVEKKIQGNVVELVVDSVLMDTEFEFSGDQFARYFNSTKTMTTNKYQAVSVQATVIQDSIPSPFENESTEDGGVSAPVELTFNAYANEPVATFYLWKIYNSNVSNTEPVLQSTAKNLHYAFEKAGRYRVDLEVSNSESSCTYSTSTSDITISDFVLKVPNAFSPTSSPGVNDIFKVSYKSIVKFNAWIYNRWGNELYHWSDPEGGWDGKYRGKFVPPGAYFYIIEAEDGNGNKHVKKGDINIVGKK